MFQKLKEYPPGECPIALNVYIHLSLILFLQDLTLIRSAMKHSQNFRNGGMSNHASSSH
jgi:hypothetical protein